MASQFRAFQNTDWLLLDPGLQFYLRPKYIWLKFKQSLRSSEEFKRNLKGFKKLSYYLLRGSDV